MPYRIVESKRWGLQEVGSKPMNEGEVFPFNHMGKGEAEQEDFAIIKGNKVALGRSFIDAEMSLGVIDGEQVEKRKIRTTRGFLGYYRTTLVFESSQQPKSTESRDFRGPAKYCSF